MALPPNAVKLGLPGVQMDPKSVLEWPIVFGGMLEAGETVASYTLTMLAESSALGLSVASGDYAPAWDGTDLIVWFEIDSSKWSDAAFSGEGAQLPMELYFETDSTPARKRELTLYLEVAQQ
jgi:hypothetical protein